MKALFKKAKQNTVLREKNVHQQICDYLKLQYRNVIFTSDASGMRVGMGLRMELKRKRCAGYVIPDLIILEPRGGHHGLIMEIKKNHSEVYTTGGMIRKDKHLHEQIRSIERLRELGYSAGFVCGFDEAKRVIDQYFKRNSKI